MLKEDEIKYIEDKIKSMISIIDNTFAHEILHYEEDYASEEFPGYTRNWVVYKIKELYYLIKVLLEVKGAASYLKDFHDEFDRLLTSEDEDGILKSLTYHPESQPELKIIFEFKRFLNPFKAFDYARKGEADSVRLSSILRHTDHILRKTKFAFTAKTNEADISKEVKWALALYYPKARLKNTTAFIHEFKTYKPDIIIPELRTVIEYKYLKNAKVNIDEYLDQIKIDATNYTGDFHYDNFIAVIYIRDTGLATEDSIRVAWAQKKFPDNWELVVAMGSK